MISRSALTFPFVLTFVQIACAQDLPPIWQMPFESLSNSLERPLFSRTRRPPPQVRRANGESDSSKGDGLDSPSLDMIGFMIGPDGLALAVVRDSVSQAIKRLHIGEAVNGWEIVTIERRELTLRQKERTISVRMQGRVPEKVDEGGNTNRIPAQSSGAAPFFPMPAPIPRPCCQ